MLQVPINSKVISSQKTKKISLDIIKGGVYKIQPGDTLSEIAGAAGVSISDIKSLNNITGDKIYVDQEIYIPDYGNIPVISNSSDNKTVVPEIAELASSENNSSELTELPSISIPLFDSKTSENTNSSKTPDKSENLIIA